MYSYLPRALAVLIAGAVSHAIEIPLDDPGALTFRNVEGRVTTFAGHPALEVLGPPTNARVDHQSRRNHSSQYISFPDHPWHRLRGETPGKYEAYVDLVPDEWTSVRVTVDGDRARLYVHEQEQPTLLVNDLKLPESSGQVALWVGPGTQAHFRSLRITPD